MMPSDDDQTPTPALMRAARGTYAQSIRGALHAAGIDDLPRNGAFALGWIEDSGGLPQELPAALGISRQAVSQLLETLVVRGFVDRASDDSDRRRISVTLTDRGHQAQAAIEQGVDAVEDRLHEQLDTEQIGAMRSGLSALAAIKAADTASGAGRVARSRQLRSFSPIFSVADLTAALGHYAALGFTTSAYSGDYGFAGRDGVSVHLAAGPGPGPASAYLYVADADALHAEWTRPGIGGHTHPVEEMPWGLREGSHTDPDGNVIRFGTPISE